MKEGDFVRHRRASGWGVGIVRSAPPGGHWVIEFESGGTKKLAAGFAAANLERVDNAAVPAAHPLRGGTKRTKTSRRAAGEPCAHCGLPLNRSLFSSDRRWKSCPRCSGVDGQHHLFYEFPDAFGISDARISDDSPDGAQSYCKTCRPTKRLAPASQGRLCPDLA
jgi:hypothetical protein